MQSLLETGLWGPKFEELPWAVDVRDAAAAHIAAMETPSAKASSTPCPTPCMHLKLGYAWCPVSAHCAPQSLRGLPADCWCNGITHCISQASQSFCAVGRCTARLHMCAICRCVALYSNTTPLHASSWYSHVYPILR